MHSTLFHKLSKIVAKNKAFLVIGLAALSLIGITASSLNLTNFNNPNKIAFAATQPTCSNRTVGNTPTFNAFDIRTNFPNPEFDSSNCYDMPTLTFFGQQTSLRNRTVLGSSSIPLQIYYNNSSIPGSPAINNPNASLGITRSGNVYTVKGSLSGTNAATMSTTTGGTAINDGDLTITVPAGFELNYQLNGQIFPQQLVRKNDIADGNPSWFNPATPSVLNPFNPATGRSPADNIGNISSIFTQFQGLSGFTAGSGINLSYQDTASQLSTNLPPNPAWYPAGINASTLYPDGVRDNNSPNTLPAGFIDYGYILLNLIVSPVQNTNQPVLNISKSATTPVGVNIPNGTAVNQNQTFNYNLNFSNTGTSGATGFTLTDTLDTTRLRFDSCTAPAGYTCTQSNGVITITANNQILPANSGNLQATVSVTVLANATGTVLNQAVISSEQNPAQTSNQTSHPILPTTTVLTILKSATPASGTAVRVNDTITYNLALRNTGLINATNVVVTDVIDTNLTYVANSCSTAGIVGATCSYNNTTRAITWNIPSFAPSVTASNLTFATNVNPTTAIGTNILNQATVTSSNSPTLISNQTTHPVTSNLADLQIDKSIPANPSSVLPGQTITYSLRYRNIGGNAATNTVITDTLDPDTTYTPNSCTTAGIVGATCSHLNGIVTWNLGTTPANQVNFTNLSYQVSVDGDAAGIINNVAIITSPDDPTGDRDEVSVPVRNPVPNLQILKTLVGNPAFVSRNQVLNYQLQFRNTGDAVSVNTIIGDTLDPDVIYVNNSCTVAGIAGATCGIANGIITWNLGDIAANQTAYTTVNYQVTVSATANGNIDNTAVITSQNDPAGDRDDVTVPVNLTAANLQIQKDIIAPTRSTITQNSVVTYQLGFRNTGSGIANNVLIQDFLDPDVTYVANSCTVTGLTAGATCSIANGILSWSGFNLSANQTAYITVTYQVRINANALGTIDNTAVITSPDDPNGDQDTENVPLNRNAANLVINKSIPANILSVNRGQTITYSLDYRNVGSVAATNTIIQDFLDPDTSYVANSCSTAGIVGATCSHANGIITWNLGTTPANQVNFTNLTYQVTVNSNASGTISNLAIISSPDDPTGDSDEVIVPVNVVFANMQIRKGTVGNLTNIRRGDTITYSLDYRNVGSVAATNTIIQDFLDPDTSYVANSCSTAGIVGATCSHANGIITWNLGTTPANQVNFTNLTYQVTVNSNASGTINNTAVITATNDPTPDSDDEILPVILPNVILEINKASSVSSSLPGSIITYTLTFRNRGTSPANNVQIVDTIDSDGIYQTGSCTLPNPVLTGSSCSENPSGSGVITWNIPTLPANAAQTYTLTYTVAVRANATGTLRNVVTIVSDEDPNGDTDTVTVVILTPASSSSSSLSSSSLPSSSSSLSSSSSSSPASSSSSSSISSSSSSLSSSSSSSVSSSSSSVPSSSSSSSSLSSSSSSSPASSSSSSSITPPLTITKTVNDTDRIVVTNQVLTYTISYRNNTNVTQTNLTVTDTLISGLEFVTGSCTPACVVNSNVLTWNLGTLAPNTGGSVSFQARVIATTGNIPNSGTIFSNQNADPAISSVNVTVRNIVVDSTIRTGGTPYLGIIGFILAPLTLLGIYLRNRGLKVRRGF